MLKNVSLVSLIFRYFYHQQPVKLALIQYSLIDTCSIMIYYYFKQSKRPNECFAESWNRSLRLHRLLRLVSGRSHSWLLEGLVLLVGHLNIVPRVSSCRIRWKLLIGFVGGSFAFSSGLFWLRQRRLCIHRRAFLFGISSRAPLVSPGFPSARQCLRWIDSQAFRLPSCRPNFKSPSSNLQKPSHSETDPEANPI